MTIHAIVSHILPCRYVSSGYAPLSVRLVELAAAPRTGGPGWSAHASTLARLLPKPALQFEQPYEPLLLEEALATPPALPPSPTKPAPGGGAAGGPSPLAPPGGGGAGSKPVMVVFYVGGVTYMEIAALRFLNTQPAFPFTIVIAATTIINGGSFLRSLIPEIDNRLKSSK